MKNWKEQKHITLEYARETAYHEAGHFFFRAVLLGNLDSVDIRESFKGLISKKGKIINADKSPGFVRSVGYIITPYNYFDLMMELYAGPLAAWKFENNNSETGYLIVENGALEYHQALECFEEMADLEDWQNAPGTDYYKINGYSKTFYVTPYGQRKIKEYACECACNILNKKPIWKNVSDLAEIIYKKKFIDSDEIYKLNKIALRGRNIYGVVFNEVKKFNYRITHFKRKNITSIIKV